MISLARGVIEELVNHLGCWSNLSDAQRRLAHTLQCESECSHMGDFPRHEELQRVLGARIAAEVDETLIDDLRPRLGSYVATQIHIKFAGDLEVIGGPGISHRIEEIDASAPRDGNQGIDFGLLAHRFERLEMHAGERADDFEMAELFRADIHQHVFATRIVAVKSLDRILHRRSELAVRASELFQEHIAETGIGLIDADGIHEFLDMMVHRTPDVGVARRRDTPGG